MTRKPEPSEQVKARVAKARATNAAKGMIRLDRWVTPEQAKAIKWMLDEWGKDQ